MKSMSQLMRYINFDMTKKAFEVKSRQIPSLEPDEELIKINAICINRLDILEKKGLYKKESEDSIMGVEFVGQKVNPDTLEITEPGTFYGSIVKSGAYAEYVNCKSDHLIKFEFDGLLEDYASIPEAFFTAYQLVAFYSDINKGDIVYIPAAASGVGTSLLQICKQVYGCKIIASCSSEPEKVDLVKKLGADLVIDYKSESDEDIAKRIHDFTEEKGVNCIFDCVGPSKSSLYSKILAQDSAWVLYGLLGGQKTDDPNVLAMLLWKRSKIIGTTLRYRSDEYKTKLISGFRDQILPYFSNGLIKPIVGTVIELSFDSDTEAKIEEAHKIMETNKNWGRIVVKFV